MIPEIGRDRRLKMDFPSSPAAVVAKVLDDDDLLREILLRVGFPTTLVRAALVCTRWYHHAADRAFLRRFRQRHPPRLLGLYVGDVFIPHTLEFLPRFVPLLTKTQELELATVLCRMATFSLDTIHGMSIKECRNGSIFISGFRNHKYAYEVHSPLFPERGVAVLPPPPPHAVTDDAHNLLLLPSQRR
ncbi:hypothetical protein BRADI_2g27197v3 [Brachypodium distachyon]|uniref:Uncharacterized protein n=2 Tax=Brachypodium distachyon TaxID=15368 RepID=A0A2K2DAV6_BRADI|nr:hypothetical protein BRADI_2g27197v3 [Brachypodium distachyon]